MKSSLSGNYSLSSPFCFFAKLNIDTTGFPLVRVGTMQAVGLYCYAKFRVKLIFVIKQFYVAYGAGPNMSEHRKIR